MKQKKKKVFSIIVIVLGILLILSLLGFSDTLTRLHVVRDYDANEMQESKAFQFPESDLICYQLGMNKYDESVFRHPFQAFSQMKKDYAVVLEDIEA